MTAAIIISFVVGFYLGFVLCAVLTMSRDSFCSPDDRKNDEV
jgi:hypothetical protein